MNKVYSRIIWKNYPNTSTAINETNLNRMDKAIDDLDNRVIEQDSTKANQTTVNNMVKNWTMNETTGVITVEKQDGSKIMFDLNIEKIPVNFELSPSGILTMTTSDGTQFTANIGSMIPVLTFNESDQIAVSVSGSGINKTYSFSIKDNSITENKLQPNFLADIKVQSANASLSANNAETSATQAKSYAIGGTGTRENEDTDNAMYYYEQAKQTDIGQISSKVDEINSKLSNQLGNHTVKSDVPENAVFTDTVYDDTEVQKRISDNGYGEVSGGKSLIPDKDMNNLLSKMSDNADGTTHSYADGVLTVNRIANVNSGVYVYSSIFKRFDNKRVKISFDAKSSVDGMFLSIFLNNSSYSYTPILTSEYKRYSVELLAGDTRHNFIIYGNAVAGEVDIKNVMFSDAAYNDTSYEPYFPSNKMLAEEKADKSETTVNLLNPTLQTTTLNGVTCTNNGDGTYTLNGTATNANATFDLSFSCSLNSSVKLLGRPKNIDGVMIQTMYNGSWDDPTTWDNTGNGAILSDASKINRLSLFVLKDKSVKNAIIKPMITTNLSATYDDFVPYTGDSGKLNSDVAALLKRIEALESLVNKTDTIATE